MSDYNSDIVEALHSIKYPRPKIIMIDLPNEVALPLQNSGYNVALGSFGYPYYVQQSNSFLPLSPNGLSLPNYTEQEIVILDMSTPDATVGLDEGKKVVNGQKAFWASCHDGVINPRPFFMSQFKERLDRIYAHGGIFVVFVDAVEHLTLAWGCTQQHRGLIVEKQQTFSTWQFLSILTGIEVQHDTGEEIKITSASGPLRSLLKKHTADGTFTCTLRPPGYLANSWTQLAVNKYGGTVAAVIHQEREGLVFILPNLTDKAHFLDSLVKEVLPDLAPGLFPFTTGRWTERAEYELPEVLEYEAQIENIVSEANKQIELREQAIIEQREQQGFLHDLITQTGEQLVKAVKKTLETLGFHAVIDADAELASSEGPMIRREDLRIEDELPIVLVEVKGINGLPNEESSLAVSKYLIPKMKQLGHTQVRGLAIINHQKNIPGLDRDKIAFQEDVVINAQDQDFALMTAWDLYRLTRSYLKNNWSHEQVKPLFFQNGVVKPVPTHYEFIGTVERYIESLGVLGIQIEASELHSGDRIAFELPVEFMEQEITSLQHENQEISTAEVGMLVGITTTLTKAQAKQSTRVLRARLTDAAPLTE